MAEENGVLDPDGVEPSDDPSLTQPQEGGDQGPEDQGQTLEQLKQAFEEAEARARKFQSLADQRLAMAQMYQQQVQQPKTETGPEQNPYNPQQDWANWLKWENRATAKETVQQALSGLFEQIQGVTRQQKEADWQAQHPDMDINAVKAFAQMNGIRELDHAFLVLTSQQQQMNAANQAVDRTFSQVRQNPATPIRGASGANVQTKLSFEKLAQDVHANPSVLEKYPKEVQEEFWREARFRANTPKPQ